MKTTQFAKHLDDTTTRTLLSRVNLEAEDQVVGTVFYKQIVRYGKWVNPLFPVEYMDLDEEFGQSLFDNFESGLIGKVPVPLDHTDYVEANTGEVIKLELKDDGVYAYLDIRRPEVVNDILNGLIFDVSISFDWNYIDTATGDEHGPTLLHVALVNNPYLTGMAAFDKIAAGVKDLSRSLVSGARKAVPQFANHVRSSVIMLSESRIKELNTMALSKITNDKEHDVEVTFKNADGEEQTINMAPGSEIEVPEDEADAVTQQIADAEAPAGDGDGSGEGEGDGSGSGDGAGDGGGAGEGAGDGDGSGAGDGGEGDGLSNDERQELSRLKQKEREMDFSKRYDELLAEGKITPAMKAKFMEFAKVENQTVQLSKSKSVSLLDAVSDILRAAPKMVELNNESGSGKSDTVTKLSKEERDRMKAMGANPDKYEELVKSGRIKSEDEE